MRIFKRKESKKYLREIINLQEEIKKLREENNRQSLLIDSQTKYINSMLRDNTEHESDDDCAYWTYLSNETGGENFICSKCKDELDSDTSLRFLLQMDTCLPTYCSNCGRRMLNYQSKKIIGEL